MASTLCLQLAGVVVNQLLQVLWPLLACYLRGLAEPFKTNAIAVLELWIARAKHGHQWHPQDCGQGKGPGGKGRALTQKLGVERIPWAIHRHPVTGDNNKLAALDPLA